MGFTCEAVYTSLMYGQNKEPLNAAYQIWVE